MPLYKILVIISGPSGSGKTTLMNHIVETFPAFKRVITVTTRAPRPGEIDGVDYTFVSIDTFKKMARDDAFLERNYYNGAWYGTPYEMFNDYDDGVPTIVTPDINGAKAIVKEFPMARTFWITVPPHLLGERLAARGDSPEDIERRMQRTEQEEREKYNADLYEYTIINRDLAKSKEFLEEKLGPHYESNRRLDAENREG